MRVDHDVFALIKAVAIAQENKRMAKTESEKTKANKAEVAARQRVKDYMYERWGINDD